MILARLHQHNELERIKFMDLNVKTVQNNPNLYFVEGFYKKSYLIALSEQPREVEISHELLILLKTSHDRCVTIKEAYEQLFLFEDKMEVSELILRQIKWLNERGMITLV
jgi:predicted nuclease of restriction endonuclease-like RecB superfamily